MKSGEQTFDANMSTQVCKTHPIASQLPVCVWALSSILVFRCLIFTHNQVDQLNEIKYIQNIIPVEVEQ